MLEHYEMDLLDAADIGTCDTVVIATGENLGPSVLWRSCTVKALESEHVIAKVKNEIEKSLGGLGLVVIHPPEGRSRACL